MGDDIRSHFWLELLNLMNVSEPFVLEKTVFVINFDMLKIVLHELSSKAEITLRSALLQLPRSKTDFFSVFRLFFELKS